ncbi:hypothetical protein [Salmon gill poxvirus]
MYMYTKYGPYLTRTSIYTDPDGIYITEENTGRMWDIRGQKPGEYQPCTLSFSHLGPFKVVLENIYLGIIDDDEKVFFANDQSPLLEVNKKTGHIIIYEMSIAVEK